MNADRSIRVFISYSHDSPEHAERVQGLSTSLARDGCDCLVDVYKDSDEDWPSWMTRQLLEADFVLCVVTETYARRFRDKELPDQGLGVGWEAGLIRRLLYAKKLHNDRIFPVTFAPADRQHIPLELEGYDFFVLDTPAGYESLLRKVLRRPLHAKPGTGTPPELGSSTAAPLFARPGEAPSRSAAACKADLSRILKHAPAELIGREDELKLLHAAWSGDTKTQFTLHGSPCTFHSRPHVLTLVALGGEGKTALVAKWVAALAAQDWPGCDAAFAWSFYSQGTREQQAASSDLFLKEALTFFAELELEKEREEIRAFAASPAGAFEKGQRLARLVGQRRSLLILDGLEPLQYAPTAPTPGELKDQGIAALLKGLAAASHGLCVVTTRCSLPDLKAFWPTPPSPSGRGVGGEGTAPEVTLLRLSPAAGVDLLKRLGVRGTAREFETLVEDVKGHALTLQIMGAFLRRAFGGDIRQRDRVRFEKADEKIDGGRAFRAMAAYAQWMEDGSDEARRELAVLRLMGLFDRPADAGCLHALLEPPAIAGLTDPLVGLAEEDWNWSITALESANLLSVARDATGALVSLDAHPHIREYSAVQVKSGSAAVSPAGFGVPPKPSAVQSQSARTPTGGDRDGRAPQTSEAWRAAHRRLYEHLCASTKEGDQPTLEDLQPLYQAVAHGCQAGLQQEAREQVYRDRVLRNREKHSTKKLGAFGSNLGAVTCFFEQPWRRIHPGFTEEIQAWLFDEAGFALRALGRLRESLEPMRAVLNMSTQQRNWQWAAISASNLSELELTLGEVAGTVVDAEQSVTYADRSGDAFCRIATRTTHADALHQAGRRAEAETRFHEAEQLLKEVRPDQPLLYSTGGFRYCSLLLAAPERAAWQRVLESRASVLECASPLVLSGGRAGSSGPTSPGAESGGGPPYSKTLRDVRERGEKMFEWRVPGDPLLDIALDHLTLGRAALYGAILEDSDLRPLTSDLSHIDAAVHGLRRAGAQEFIVLGLLTRAWLRYLEGKRIGPESAQADLDEAWEIAERGPMRLFMADIHLHRARLFGTRCPEVRGQKSEVSGGKYPWDSPEADLKAAEVLINQCGYHRRDEELADAKRAILGSS